ncbi:MAG: cache domain-containing protein [Deltaproteobacteria bacterium]|nr:cache domain-containing protein [Deltaproteobacteria bacterium]
MTAEAKIFPLKWKLVLANLSLPLLTMALATAFSIHVINSFIFKQAQSKIVNDLSAAHEIYSFALRDIDAVVRLVASGCDLVQALTAGRRTDIQRVMQRLRVTEKFDFLTLTDSSGRVVVRAHNPYLFGDRPALSLVNRALIGEHHASTEILPASEIAKESRDLERQVHLEIVPTPKARRKGRAAVSDGMVLVSAWPVCDRLGNIIGAVYGGVLLNRNYTLVDTIKKVVFHDAVFAGQDIGTATIFQDDVRISTNVKDSVGRRAIGTQVSREVYERVVNSEQKWTDRAFVVNNWYISAYEPIYNYERRVIGILYVGMLERPFVDFRNRIVMVLLFILGLGSLATFLVVFIVARNVSRRLMNMEEEMQKVADGDLGRLVGVHGNDEISLLATRFNQMIAALRERDSSIEKFNRNLEETVAQRTAELETRNLELLRTKQDLLKMMADKDEINRRLEESLARLQAAQEQLVRSGKLAALGSLVAGVAHEVNNPINVITGNIELIEMDAEMRQRFADEISLIKKQSQRIQKIVKNMLGFSRVRQTAFAEVDLNEVVTRVLASLEPQLEELGIRLETDLGSLPRIMNDEDHLVQVVTNIIVNSLQAMPGGGTLRVRTVSGDAGRLQIIISDTGCGMTPAEMENMFNPFYTTKQDGTGLGLSISYELIRSLGGDIEVSSEVGRGTTITIVLAGNLQSGQYIPPGRQNYR